MFNKVVPVAALLSMLLTACSATDNEMVDVAKVNADEEDEMICRMEKRVGSNRMTRICYTAEERERMEEAGREGFFRLQSVAKPFGSGQ